MDGNHNFRKHYSQKKKGKSKMYVVVVSFSHGLYYNFCAWGMGMFTSVYQIAIEKIS